MAPSQASNKQVYRLFYFVHIPKTGGVSLKSGLHQRFGMPADSIHAPQSMLLHGTYNRKKKILHMTRLLSRGHLSAHQIDPRVPKFCILRDPYDRVASAFRYVSEGGSNGEIWGNHYIRSGVGKLFKQHQIRSVADIFRCRDQRARQTILDFPHFRTMSSFVTDPKTGGLLVDRVFVLEELDTAAVSDMLHVPAFQLPHKNQSRSGYSLSAADREHIRKHYYADIELYNQHAKQHRV